jgi:uridine phosphorylase
MHFLDTDLMLNQDGSTYHLHAFPGDIADKVIFVGDGGRALDIAQRFDRIELKRHYRGFLVITGYIGLTRLSVVNTAIGSGNIDIVLNELDALVNIDFTTKQLKPSPTSLQIIRLGTAGGIQDDIEPGTLVLATHGLATDGLMSYYDTPAYQAQDHELFHSLLNAIGEPTNSRNVYLGRADANLQRAFQSITRPGISFTAVGFYGPQYRQLRLAASQRMALEHLQAFAKLEMETAMIYALGGALGHACCSISCIVVNRRKNTRCTDVKAAIDQMIDQSLEVIVRL